MEQRIGTSDVVASDGGDRMPDCQSCGFRFWVHSNGNGAVDCASIRVLSRGERLAMNASDCRRFWTVLSGTAAICTGLPDGRRQIVGFEMAGDIICAMAFLNGSESWIEALCDCRICEVDFSGTGAALREDADLAALMFRQVHSRLQAATLHQVALGRLDGMERMYLFLSDMARRAGADSSGSVRLTLPMSREDIADYLGLNSETVSRILSRIKKSRQVIFLSRNEFLIPDTGALERRVPIELRQARPEPRPDPHATAEWSQ